MGYKTDPRTDPKYVVSLEGRLTTRYQSQRALDTKMLDLYVQKHVMDVKKPDSTETALKPVGSGLAGLLIDQDVAVLSGDPVIRITPRGGATAEKHVSDKLEPFASAGLRKMQSEFDVQGPSVLDGRIYGRFWQLGPIPAPFFWGDEELTDLYEKLLNAEDEKKPEIRKEIESYQLANFPIVWRHWSARDTWPVFNDRGQPAEVVYTRKMCADDIIDRWGDGALPGTKKYKDDEELKVIHYVNHKFTSTVIADNKDPKVAHTFEHRMKTIPITFGEVDPLPENDYGYHWKGAAFHLRELIPSIDETLTDIRTNIREYTTVPPFVKLNTEARGQLEGWPTNVEVKQGQTVNLLIDEEPGRWPISQVNVDAYQYLGIARGIADQVGIRRDALIGTGPSGQSAVHLNEANQIAKAELKRPHKGMERAVVRNVQLLFRSVIALNEEFEGADKVTVKAADRRNKSKEIAVGPEDVKDYLDMIEATIDLALPVNEGANVTNYQVAVNSGALAPASARERYLNHQNPQEEDVKIFEHKAWLATTNVALAAIQARAAGGIEQVGAAAITPEGLPDFAVQALQASEGEQMGSEAATVQRGAMNQARRGRGQNMSELSGINGQ